MDSRAAGTRSMSGLSGALMAIAAAIAVPIASPSQAARQAPEAPRVAKVDAIFSRFTGATAGCAVGVSEDGEAVLERAYGMADLEHDVPNRPATIFEIGSVSKQFTAAAVLLLVRDGKLSLDDEARKYLPEVPDYGRPLTIRHMLAHTSGLRDWGSVVDVGGWPRTTRLHTHAHVLDVVSRQRALNFPPGTRWSYSNTGYNLAAVLVSRLSGQSFADFTRDRIFKPLGMTRTSWRDDYTRIVKNRAIAYDEGPAGLRMSMPFENVHGNGALLSTVGDLLTWNEHFESPRVGGASLVADLQTLGRFTDGRPHDYAFGLFVGQYNGLRQVSHSGGTAGYRAYLVRFPERRVSVAVLCNAGAASRQSEAAYQVADLFLEGHLKPPPPIVTQALGQSQREAIDGLYVSRETGETLTILNAEDGLRFETDAWQTGDGSNARARLLPLSASRFVSANGRVGFEIAGPIVQRTDHVGTVDRFARVERVKPSAGQLGAFAGRYRSDEAEVVVDISLNGDALALKRSPDTVIKLTPLYQDAFRGTIGVVRFHRNAGEEVTGLSLSQTRLWDLRFTRLEGTPAASRDRVESRK